MKIGFNARLLVSPTLRGWNRYTINLLVELAHLGVELVLYTDRPIHPNHLSQLPTGRCTVRVAPPMKYPLWEQVWLPKQCRQDHIDIFHCPFHFGIPVRMHCPTVLTLHDAIDHIYYAPQQTLAEKLKPANLQNLFYQWLARVSATHIITVSEYSKTDLIRHLKISENKISVTYEAADAKFHQPITAQERARVREHYQLHSPYIFYIGGWEQRKNIPFLLTAFAQAQLTGVSLVLAGGNTQQKLSLLELAQALDIADRLILLEWVEDVDLPALYAEALCFVYPSEYEGFGLQLCEAMAVGCPVLAARATCLPEIVGEGGMLFSLEDITALMANLKEIFTNPDYHHQLSQQSRLRSNYFQWKNTAQESLRVYEGLCK
jgi:glycosyltransferase involved in cell wall biosynthesis